MFKQYKLNTFCSSGYKLRFWICCLWTYIVSLSKKLGIELLTCICSLQKSFIQWSLFLKRFLTITLQNKVLNSIKKFHFLIQKVRIKCWHVYPSKLYAIAIKTANNEFVVYLLCFIYFTCYHPNILNEAK